MSKSTVSKKKPNKMLIGGIAAIVAAIGLLGGGLYFILSDDSETPSPSSVVAIGEEDSATACQNLLSSYYSAFISEDSTTLYKLMAPPEYWTYYMEEYNKNEAEIIATYDDAINNTLATWKADCGTNVKVSFKIKASAEQSDEFLAEWSQAMNDTIGSEALNAQEALTLEVVQTVLGDSGSKETTIHPTLIKVNDAWYILDEGADTQTTTAQ